MKRMALTFLLFVIAPVAQAQITLEVADSTGSHGSEIEIPILVHDASELGPVQFELTFDPDVLEAIDAEAGSTLSGLVDSFVPSPGQMNIGAITNAALTGEGELVKARFRVTGGSGGQTVVSLQNAQAFEYGRLTDVWVDSDSGSFRVTGLPWMILLLALAALALMLTLLLWLRSRRGSRRGAGAVQPEAARPVAVPLTGSGGGFCRQCGTAFEAGDRFCGGCGHTVEARAAEG